MQLKNKNMKRNLALAITMFHVLVFFGYAQSKTKIELKDNWYHLDGQKYFIKAIGYEIGARPGQHPYEDAKKDEPVAEESKEEEPVVEKKSSKAAPKAEEKEADKE